MNRYFYNKLISILLVIFVSSPVLCIAAKQPDNDNVRSYVSPLNQNTLEQKIKDFLLEKGFTYRRDKDIREGVLRRFRFDRDDISLDVNLFALKSKGTLVMVYRRLIDALDTKDITSFVKKPSLELPDYKKVNNPQIVTFQPLEEGRFGVSYKSLDIPLPKESELISGAPPDALIGVSGSGKVYKSSKKPKEINSFYRSALRKIGFRENPSMSFKGMGAERLRFESSDKALELYVSSNGEKGSVFILIQYPDKYGVSRVEENPLAMISLPTKDNPKDSDLPDIPRPKGSVRWGSSGNQSTYILPISISDARLFYRQEMSALGWRLNKEVRVRKSNDYYAKSHNGKGIIPNVPLGPRIDLGEIVKDSYILDFNSPSATALVMIYPNFVNSSSGSIVDITYNYETIKEKR